MISQCDQCKELDEGVLNLCATHLAEYQEFEAKIERELDQDEIEYREFERMVEEELGTEEDLRSYESQERIVNPRI